MSRNNPPSDPDIQIPRLPISRLRMTRHYNFAPCDIFISHLATSPYRTLPPQTIASCDSKAHFRPPTLCQPPLGDEHSLLPRISRLTQHPSATPSSPSAVRLGTNRPCKSTPRRLEHVFRATAISCATAWRIANRRLAMPSTEFMEEPIYFTFPFPRRAKATFRRNFQVDLRP